MNIRKISDLIRFLININCVLLFIFPLFETYMPYEEEGVWEAHYLINKLEVLTFIGPFLIAWILYQLLENKIVKIVLQIITILISGVYLFYVYPYFSFPMQDFSPSFGLICLMLFCPLLSMMAIFQFMEKKNNRERELEDILDA